MVSKVIFFTYIYIHFHTDFFCFNLDVHTEKTILRDLNTTALKDNFIIGYSYSKC